MTNVPFRHLFFSETITEGKLCQKFKNCHFSERLNVAALEGTPRSNFKPRHPRPFSRGSRYKNNEFHVPLVPLFEKVTSISWPYCLVPKTEQPAPFQKTKIKILKMGRQTKPHLGCHCVFGSAQGDTSPGGGGKSVSGSPKKNQYTLMKFVHFNYSVKIF